MGYRLYYWALRGRGEQVRLRLESGGLRIDGQTGVCWVRRNVLWNVEQSFSLHSNEHYLRELPEMRRCLWANVSVVFTPSTLFFGFVQCDLQTIY